jgi:hypothetical protein
MLYHTEVDIDADPIHNTCTNNLTINIIKLQYHHLYVLYVVLNFTISASRNSVNIVKQCLH